MEAGAPRARRLHATRASGGDPSTPAHYLRIRTTSPSIDVYNAARVRLRLPIVTAWFFSALYAGIALQEHLARGGPELGRTIASRSSLSPKSAEDTLLLFEDASKVLPRGATVTVLKPLRRDEDKQVLRFSHGQLPHQRVVPQTELPDFIITLGAPLGDARYELLHANEAGAIWKRTRW